MNTLAVVTIVSLVIGVSLLAVNSDENEVAIQKKTLDIHRSLYSSSLLLAAGVLEIFCLFGWAAALEPKSQFYAEAGKSLIIAGGIFFTLMLLVIYVPLFMARNETLRNHTRDLKFSSKEELENWYAVNQMERNSGASVNDMIAFILPIAAGILVNVLSAELS